MQWHCNHMLSLMIVPVYFIYKNLKHHILTLNVNNVS